MRPDTISKSALGRIPQQHAALLSYVSILLDLIG
jgi:hypothetical protein